MDSSVYHPIETSIWIEGDNLSSVAVYFDGNYTAPEENIFGPGNGAHGYLWAPTEPAEIAFRFLLDGEIFDACDGDCNWVIFWLVVVGVFYIDIQYSALSIQLFPFFYLF